ncbi:RNA polymerase sigma factor [Collibacillus ludicampi]|uniref:RNA polymerase sigma factor n=1 Tax=Collibacillus ludicampi TaxID=2771369 RepID=A0AAV4LEG6_9BACL|nr:sigma-70 family RNA polymerase sigma factor [Collibacillus ludicampi]GIM45837.1 RNA polymerase sigma factor [Collibacillus ludicampi]
MNNSNELNQLVSLSLAGDREAFSEIYEQTIGNVYKTVHFLLEDKSDLEDVVQEIYIQLHKSLARFDITKSFHSWLMGIVIRQVNSNRRKKWMRFRITNKNMEQPQILIEPDFSDGVVDNLSNEQLLNTIQHLPFKLKQVIILHYLNDYSQEEVAKILDIPLGTVKSRINSALTKLRQKKESSVNLLRKVENQHEF